MGKTCVACGVVQPLSEFSPRAAMRDGHRSECKACCRLRSSEYNRANPARAKAKHRKHYLKHREERIAAAQRWREANRDKAAARDTQYQRVSSWHVSLTHRCKSVAKKKGLEFDLDADFLEALFAHQQQRCHWLGVVMVPSEEARNPLQPSVDRVDPAKGYTRDNVVLASQFANMGRSAMSADRFREFIATLAEHFASSALRAA